MLPFSSIDSYSKKITNEYFSKHSKLPEWLRSEGKPIEIPHHNKYKIFDEKTNILLTGKPDEMVQLNNGSYFIIDYKTAKYTNNQDYLFPLYYMQLNGYAYIAEQLGYNPVTRLALVYYEPFTDISAHMVDNFIYDDGFSMNFSSKIVNVDLDTKTIPFLLKNVRKIFDMSTCPERMANCKNCNLLDNLSLII